MRRERRRPSGKPAWVRAAARRRRPGRRCSPQGRAEGARGAGLEAQQPLWREVRRGAGQSDLERGTECGTDACASVKLSRVRAPHATPVLSPQLLLTCGSFQGWGPGTGEGRAKAALLLPTLSRPPEALDGAACPPAPRFSSQREERHELVREVPFGLGFAQGLLAQVSGLARVCAGDA